MGHVTEDTGLYPGWVPGPNPFGNQRADDTQTWYRKEGNHQFEIRMDFIQGGWLLSKAVKASNSQRIMTKSEWSAFRAASTIRFHDPMAAMLWFEMNKGDL